MVLEFRLPDIGEGMVEAEVVKWYVQEGDTIEEDQPMVELMTDKANVVIPSPRKGVVLKRLGREGEVVKVGSVLIVIGDPGEASATAAPVEAPVSAPAVQAGPPPTPMADVSEAPIPSGRVLATPATRRVARELGVDLRQVPPTGPHGRVTKEDVIRFVEVQRAPTIPPASVEEPVAPEVRPPAGLEERIPLRGLRRVIARRMVQSKHTAAHFTYVEEVDMTELVRLRDRMKPIAEAQGVRLTYLPFIIKAVIIGLKRFPIVNASLDDEKEEIVLKKYYHIGIAVQTDQGLTVPVIHDADKRSLLDLAREVERLATAAREGRLVLHEARGSTFTITSLGKLGGLLATPIINYPEVAILGVHKIEPRPVVRDGEIVIRSMMNISLSFDHRVVDGAVGAEFTQVVREHLENPHLLFLQM
ncbi:MAG: 2-oxo acid dehydrogenase subunit E2 [Acidobacteria bacterium]|nr:2-oxo acid dehydrogenase subunit E2 [Acidobacteriota bacterium]MDW7983802.1 dihydrolipoamide acetyltransferase family protein [Acidobacteriota bacterium]